MYKHAFFAIMVMLAMSGISFAEDGDYFLRKGAWACKDMVSTRKANKGAQVEGCLFDMENHARVQILHREPGYAVKIRGENGGTYIATPEDIVFLTEKEQSNGAEKRREVVIEQETGSIETSRSTYTTDEDGAKHVHGSNTRFWELDGIRLQIIRMDVSFKGSRFFDVKYRVKNNSQFAYSYVKFSIDFYNGKQLVNTEVITVFDFDPQEIYTGSAIFNRSRFTSIAARVEDSLLN